MAIVITPLGFQKPDGNELVKNGDNVIAANAQKANDLIAEDRSRLDIVEGAVAGIGPGGGGGSVTVNGDYAPRPIIGARVGAGSVNTIPDSQYFDELHSLESLMEAEADITNWYRAIGPSSAADFTATVVPELAAHPNRKILYVLETHKSNAQFNREMTQQDGVYPYLVATLQAIKNSGYADRVYIAPFHEGNGGGGTGGSIGAYEWQMYDTTTGQLYTPGSSDPMDPAAGTKYGATFRLNTPTQYKTAFRNVVSLARSIGLTSKFVHWFLAANNSDSYWWTALSRWTCPPATRAMTTWTLLACLTTTAPETSATRIRGRNLARTVCESSTTPWTGSTRRTPSGFANRAVPPQTPTATRASGIRTLSSSSAPMRCPAFRGSSCSCRTAVSTTVRAAQ